jgi:hypothetical protein
VSVVYFVQAGAGGPIKIGVASDLNARVGALQTGCPELLVVLASIEGDAATETIYHAHLRRFRLRGEWFKPAPEVLECVDRAKSGLLPEELRPRAADDGEYFSHVRNLVGWVRALVRCQGWSASRLAVEAGLHRNTLLGCEREDWNPTYSTLLAIEAVAHRSNERQQA